MEIKILHKVKFISNRCTDDDKLANHPHESVAKSLFDLLRNHPEIENPVIGLEGSWGSGKSQVIRILQRLVKEVNLDKDYKFVNYDIWSVQEDLTRKSFLDAVLSDAKEDNDIFETKELKEDYDKLNATVFIRTTKTFPLVRLFFATILLIPISIFLVDAFANFLGDDFDTWLTYDELKGLLSLIFTGLSLVAFSIALYEEYTNLDCETKKKGRWEKFQIVVGRLFYIFKAKDVERKDHEMVIKDEPSVSRFQDIFKHIYKGLKDGKKLIIVFDNMDRLSDSQKLMSTWSLLHTFFAEKNYKGKIWAIVPFARKQLSELMIKGKDVDTSRTSEDFINKTFFTTFRIPEPIMGSWKQFLSDKLDEAFEPVLDEEEKNLITLIFSRSMAGKVMRPRDIIAFTNRLVAIYSQHFFEEIPLRYVALYAQYEKVISEKPADAILQFKGFENMVAMVGKEELSKWLSSIYYNLPSDKALEVVYDREITTFLVADYEINGVKDEAEDAYKNLSANEHFHHHIEEYFNKDVDYVELKLENVFYLLEQENISKAIKKKIFEDVANHAEQLKEQLSCYQPWMENAFENYDVTSVNILIDALLENSHSDLETSYQTIIPLLKLKDERDGIVIKHNSQTVFDVNSMLAYHLYLKEENAEKYYKAAGISMDISKLLEYMTAGVGGSYVFGQNTSKVYDLLKLLKKNGADLKAIENHVNSASLTVSTLNEEQVRKIYTVNEIVKSTPKAYPPYTTIEQNVTPFLVIPEFFACVLYAWKQAGHNVTILNNCLSTNLPDDKHRFVEVLKDYFSYDELIKIAIDTANKMVIDICKYMAVALQGTINKTNQILENTQNVINLIFKDDPEVFIHYLDNNDSRVVELTSSVLDIDGYWCDNISKENIANHPIYATIRDKWLEEMASFEDGTWKDIFTEDDNTANVIIKLNEIGELPKDFWKKIPTGEVGSTFTAYVVDGKSIRWNLFSEWKNNMGKAVLGKIANNTMDAITAPTTIEAFRFIQFVDLLIVYSGRMTEPKRANTLYDEFLAEYLEKDDTEHIAKTLLKYHERIEAFATNLDQERKELLSDRIGAIAVKIDSKSEGYKGLIDLRDKVKPEVPASEDEGEKEGEKE
jgi:hypothetical protein